VSAKTEISLLTCKPHAQIYSLYGHTAIRVVDTEQNTDVAINWGVFDASQPNFVAKFVLGFTDYTMSIVPTEYFLREYEYYGSPVYQQRLNLTEAEKARIMKALDENYRPENRVYRYNYVYDNCTTRARDIILSNIDGKTSCVKTFLQKGDKTFRDLLHWKTNKYGWCKAGNDLVIGLRADRNAIHSEREFLPEILAADFDSATIIRADGKQVALVDSAFWLLKDVQPHFEPMPDFPLTPTMFAIIILALVIVWTLYERTKKKRLKWLDVVFFYICGIAGLLPFAMIFSQHPFVQINLQLLVLNPLWLFLMSPWTKWKHRWNVALVMVVLFFIGNIFQSYAEGMNILALSLLVRIISNRLKYKE
jgi:hypothetical protein